MKKVLILGGGFAGVQTAIELQKSKLFEVTLVSDRDYLFLYPISIWIPVRTNKFEDVKARSGQRSALCRLTAGAHRADAG